MKRAPLLLLLVSGQAWAYRPFEGTDAEVVDVGEVELELGPVAIARVGGEMTYAPGVVVNAGFAHGFEVVAEGDVERASDTVVDSDVLVKYAHAIGATSVGVEAGVLLPTLDGEGSAGFIADAIVTRRWPSFAVHLNGIAAHDRDGVWRGEATVIVEGARSSRVRPVAEGVAGRGRTGGLLGAIWQQSEHSAFDLAIVIGQDDRYEARAGWTVTL